MASLLLLGLTVNQLCLCHVSSSETSGLRAGLKDNAEREFKRKSVIRRLYGSENGEVRKHVRLLEEKSERSRTGFMGDPDHQVPYENHPYQKTYDRRRRERERKLQDTEYIQSTVVEEGAINTARNTTTTTTTDDLYKPLRIRFETQALDATRDATNAAKIDFFKTQIFPQ